MQRIQSFLRCAHPHRSRTLIVATTSAQKEDPKFWDTISREMQSCDRVILRSTAEQTLDESTWVSQFPRPHKDLLYLELEYSGNRRLHHLGQGKMSRRRQVDTLCLRESPWYEPWMIAMPQPMKRMTGNYVGIRKLVLHFALDKRVLSNPDEELNGELFGTLTATDLPTLRVLHLFFEPCLGPSADAEEPFIVGGKIVHKTMIVPHANRCSPAGNQNFPATNATHRTYRYLPDARPARWMGSWSSARSCRGDVDGRDATLPSMSSGRCRHPIPDDRAA
jgi:hypothetical protein